MIRGVRLPPSHVTLAVALLLTSASPVKAQDDTLSARIEGVLLDEQTGGPVSLGLIRLVSAEGETVASVEADAEGRFSLRMPGPAQYHLIVERVGYQSMTGGASAGSGDQGPNPGLLFSPEDLEGVEVYVFPTIPAELNRGFPCGVVAFWTRRDAGPDSPQHRWRRILFGGAILAVALVLSF